MPEAQRRKRKYTGCCCKRVSDTSDEYQQNTQCQQCQVCR
nr:unnamed protein product [Callosobruchus analis]